ncbi:MAG: LemA family protein [Nanoarchaeota archaeon]
MTILLWILIIAAFLIALMFFIYYNKFARLTNQIENSLAQIDVQLRKRADLVPNLVEAVKGYMKHEKGIITEITNARKALLSAGNLPEKVKAGDKLQNAIKSIFVIAENYPNLKANENFLQLQQELASIEDKVAYARQYYNDGIMSYNTSTTTIPGKWFAGLYGYHKKDYLQIPESAREVPKLKFD